MPTPEIRIPLRWNASADNLIGNCNLQPSSNLLSAWLLLGNATACLQVVNKCAF